MPKKSKRESQKMRKKKVSTAELSPDNPLANTVINIVDPGESGIDISAEEIRKKEEAAKKLVMAPNIVAKEDQTFVQSKEEVQAIRKELKGDEIESEIDEFAIIKSLDTNQKKPDEKDVQTYVATTSITIQNPESEKDTDVVTMNDNASQMTHDSQIADSLAVNIGSVSSGTTMESSQSVNSSFSYFSDSNLVKTEEISSDGQEQSWSKDNSFSSILEEAAVPGDSTGNDPEKVEIHKRLHVTPGSGNSGNKQDIFLEELKEEILEVKGSIETAQETESLKQEEINDETLDSLVEKSIVDDALLIKSTTQTEEGIKKSGNKDENVDIKKRSHVSPNLDNTNDIFLEGLKEEILEDNERNENKCEEKKVLQTRASGWDNIIIKKEIKVELKRPDSHDHDDDQWKEHLMEIKRKGIVLEERTLHTYFEKVETKVFDTELGYGLVSENKEQPKIKIVLKGNSPFLNNDSKTLHLRLADLHLYSQVYRIMEATITQPGRTFYIFRHYLHLPSMTNEEIDSLKVAACEETDQENIEFIEPLYIDDDFVVVEQKLFTWFLVVSEFANLPVRVNFVPFMERGSTSSPIFICPLPRGRHHIAKLLSENPGWKKCGYEEPSVLQKGMLYNFSTDVWGKREPIGKMRIETWGHDTKWVVFKPEMFKPQNFIETTLTKEGTNEFIFSGPLSLYDILRVEVEVPFYQKKVTSWEISTIDKAILADLPPYGRVSNLEPFFAYVRAGRLSLSQLKAILTHLGYSDTPDPATAVAEDKIAAIVKTYLQDWKEKNGSQATLVEFLSVLRMADVALASIAMEIINNISNSNCGIAAYSIN